MQRAVLPLVAVPRLPDDVRRRVKPYRGGYLAGERREIEDELFGGRLDGVVATSALELGIDVGGLDAVVLNGFPVSRFVLPRVERNSGRSLFSAPMRAASR